MPHEASPIGMVLGVSGQSVSWTSTKSMDLFWPQETAPTPGNYELTSLWVYRFEELKRSRIKEGQSQKGPAPPSFPRPGVRVAPQRCPPGG
jgi:hypothetical protein